MSSDQDNKRDDFFKMNPQMLTAHGLTSFDFERAARQEKFYNTVVLSIEEALNWIAFSNFAGPFYGPIPMSRCAYKDKEGYEHDYFEDLGRHNLALEMISILLRRGAIALYGKFLKWDEDKEYYESADRKPVEIIDVKIIANILQLNGCVSLDEDSEHGYGIWGAEDGACVDLFVGHDELTVAFPWRAPLELPSTENSTLTASPSQNRRGRPKKHNWEAFLQEVARMANRPDGLPERMGHLEKIMAQWCLETWGCEPSESQIREKLTPLYRLHPTPSSEAEN